MQEILKRRQAACRQTIERLRVERDTARRLMLEAREEAEKRTGYHAMVAATLSGEEARLEELEALEVELRVSARRGKP